MRSEISVKVELSSARDGHSYVNITERTGPMLEVISIKCMSSAAAMTLADTIKMCAVNVR